MDRKLCSIELIVYVTFSFVISERLLYLTFSHPFIVDGLFVCLLTGEKSDVAVPLVHGEEASWLKDAISSPANKDGNGTIKSTAIEVHLYYVTNTCLISLFCSSSSCYPHNNPCLAKLSPALLCFLLWDSVAISHGLPCFLFACLQHRGAPRRWRALQ